MTQESKTNNVSAMRVWRESWPQMSCIAVLVGLTIYTDGPAARAVMIICLGLIAYSAVYRSTKTCLEVITHLDVQVQNAKQQIIATKQKIAATTQELSDYDARH